MLVTHSLCAEANRIRVFVKNTNEHFEPETDLYAFAYCLRPHTGAIQDFNSRYNFIPLILYFLLTKILTV